MLWYTRFTEAYPKDLTELELNFSSKEACRNDLASLRWPKGFLCPACGHEESWRLAAGLFKCKVCNQKTSVISGTISEDTRKPPAS